MRTVALILAAFALALFQQPVAAFAVVNHDTCCAAKLTKPAGCCEKSCSTSIAPASVQLAPVPQGVRIEPPRVTSLPRTIVSLFAESRGFAPPVPPPKI